MSENSAFLWCRTCLSRRILEIMGTDDLYAAVLDD